MNIKQPCKYYPQFSHGGTVCGGRGRERLWCWSGERSEFSWTEVGTKVALGAVCFLMGATHTQSVRCVRGFGGSSTEGKKKNQQQKRQSLVFVSLIFLKINCTVLCRCSRLPGQQAAGWEDRSSSREEAGPGGSAQQPSWRAQTSLLAGGSE